MWKLQTPSKKLIEWYKKTMLDGLYSRIKKIENENPVLEQRIQDILIPNINGTDNKSILEALLISKPVELYQLCDRLMKQIIPNYNKNELQSYFNVKYKKKRSKDEDVLYKKYSSVLNKLLDVFDYKEQLSKNKSRSYKLSMEQGSNTCVYCNRQYVITIDGKNDNERIVRPQLDHWFSKELYPLMSLSIYNLIPCCSICNSSIKGNSIFSFDTHIHPYLDSTPNEPTFRFNYKLEKNMRYSVICITIVR